jgi:hypothetical protein
MTVDAFLECRDEPVVSQSFEEPGRPRAKPGKVPVAVHALLLRTQLYEYPGLTPRQLIKRVAAGRQVHKPDALCEIMRYDSRRSYRAEVPAQPTAPPCSYSAWRGNHGLCPQLSS